MTCLREVRRRWSPLIKTGAASGADVLADWVYYFRIVQGAAVLDKYELPLFVFAIVSSVMGGLTLISLLCKGCCPNKSRAQPTCTLACFARRINQFLALEIILEDIPQFVLTTLIRNELGQWTASAVFNVTTSGFNFVFNLLDMMTPDNNDDTAGEGAEV